MIMGLIKAGIGALGGTLADQWKEFFYCESMPKEVLVTKGQKRVSGRSSNTKGNDNIISNGSGIAVADGQCMIIVEQGKIVEVCAEPGENLHMTPLQSRLFLPAVSARASRKPLRPSANASLTAVIPERISAFTISIPRS